VQRDAAVSDRPLVYTEFAPGADARDIALTYWGFQVRALPHEGFVHRVWPDGCVSLTLVCVNGRGVGAHVLGVRQTPYDVSVHPGVQYWGVRFRPEVGAAWLGVAPADIREQNALASTFLGDAAMQLAEQVAALGDVSDVQRVFDAWIASRAFDRARIDTVVRTAAAAIVATQGQRAIADIAADVQVSPRVLQRRFGAAVGISPKAFAVLRRARSALKRVVDDGVGRDVGGWSGVALASGYADQAHFVREVARLTRFAPTALRARLDTIEHEQLAD
jgi:AraC-like DNA-binding protein